MAVLRAYVQRTQVGRLWRTRWAVLSHCLGTVSQLVTTWQPSVGNVQWGNLFTQWHTPSVVWCVGQRQGGYVGVWGWGGCMWGRAGVGWG